MRTAVDSGVDVDVRGLRESPTQAEGISVRGAGGCILSGKRSDPMLWMAVTADRFELPLCVEESATILARKLHTTESTVRARKLRQNSGKICGYRIVAVEEER
nr:MAG TPA: hypothetical protein [Caudoviricetes sp.]